MLKIIENSVWPKEYAKNAFYQKLPKGAQFLRLHAHQDILNMDFLVDTANQEETRCFRAYIYLYNDQWLADESMDNLTYLGTLDMPINIRLLQLFELKRG